VVKKVLFLINTLGGGGAERVLVNLVNNLDKTKYDITVKTLFDVGVNRNYLNSDIKYKFVFKRMIRGNSKLFKLFPAKALYKKVVNEDYDIVVAYMHGIPSRIIGGCADPKVKLISWLHVDMSKSSLRSCYWTKKELIDCFNKFAAIVGVSRTVVESFSKMTGMKENLYVKYNTNDVDKIIKLSKEAIEDVVFKDNKIKVCTLGRLVYQKGYDRLLRVHKRLIDNGYDYDLYIFGDGEEERPIKKFIEENNLSDSVHLMGFKSNPYKYMKEFDFFVCSSRYEGLSTAVSEALILGLPVVTTDCSGMTEVLGENNEFGLIVNNEEENLYLGMEQFLKDSNLVKFYKQKAIERSSFFSVKSTVNAVEELLNEV
jgi:glycosyltransferase involved in cell wall biosynthesis